MNKTCFVSILEFTSKNLHDHQSNINSNMFLLGSRWDPIVCNDIVIAHESYILIKYGMLYH